MSQKRNKPRPVSIPRRVSVLLSPGLWHTRLTCARVLRRFIFRRLFWLRRSDPPQLLLERGLVLIAAQLAGGFDESLQLGFFCLMLFILSFPHSSAFCVHLILHLRLGLLRPAF